MRIYSERLEEIIRQNREYDSLKKHSDYEVLAAMHTVVDWSGDFHSCCYESASIQATSMDSTYEYIYVVDIEKKRVEVEVIWNKLYIYCIKCIFDVINTINERLRYGRCYIIENELVFNISDNYSGIIGYECISSFSQQVHENVVDSIKVIVESFKEKQLAF